MLPRQPGIFAVSRIDRDKPHEILVALNNSPELATAEIQTLSTSHQWEPLFASTKEGSRFEHFGTASFRSSFPLVGFGPTKLPTARAGFGGLVHN